MFGLTEARHQGEGLAGTPICINECIPNHFTEAKPRMIVELRLTRRNNQVITKGE